MTIRQLTDSPAKLVEDGRAHHGVFRQPLHDPNVLDCDPFGLHGLTPSFIRRLRLKDWQHFAIIHPDFYFGTVVFNTGFSANSFFFVFDRRTSILREHRRMLAPAQAVVSHSLYDGTCSVNMPGYKIKYRNTIGAGVHEINVNIRQEQALPAISGTLRVLEDTTKYQPLIVSLPIEANHFMYSHKTICPVEGELLVAGETVRLDPARDTALIDVHKAYYPHHFWWKWANFAGFDSSGKMFGANLTDNLIKDQDSWNENAMWYDGAISLLGPAEFEFDPADTLKPWCIHDRDGRVDLSFTPQGLKTEDLNLLVFKTHYRQPLGIFNGTLTDDSGVTHKVDSVFGVVEHMDSYL